MSTLWLIGMMGAGKSTVAPVVARRLGMEWVDTDWIVAERSEGDMAQRITVDEAGFRRDEATVLQELAGTQVVVACGGGVVLDRENVALMRAQGCVIWLDAAPEVLTSRVGEGAQRPLLLGNPAAALPVLLAERRGLYADAAHAVVDASGSPEDVADRVVEAWVSCS